MALEPSSDRRASPAALRFDVVAGLTAAAVVLPKAMAYAAVAGLPVAVGLYTAFIPMIVYAVLGTSRVLSVSSTTTFLSAAWRMKSFSRVKQASSHLERSNLFPPFA